MRTWTVSRNVVLIALILGGIGIAGPGCARRARVQAPPSTDVTAGPKGEAGEPAPGDTASGVRLPGQNRVLPSEDPRNRPQPGLPGAAPAVPPAMSEPAAPVASEPVAPAVSEPVTPAVSEPAAPAPPDPATAARSEPALPRPGPADPAQDLRPPAVPAGEIRYRVQLFASSQSYPAFAMRDEISSGVSDPVYIEQEEGLWKVRVGDCRTREEANALRRRMIGLGYADAFVREVRGSTR